MSNQSSNNSEVSAVLAKMADLPDFLGIKLSSVHDRGTLGDTPLHVAATWGDVKVGKLLLDAGADPNVHGEYGNTPLHEAVGEKNCEFVKLLLTHGASKELHNEDGLTPVDLAAQSNNPHMREMFS
jgi:ankyrin repeat protein